MIRPFPSSSPKWMVNSDGSGTLYSTAVWCDMNCTASGTSGLQLEALDVGEVPSGLRGPTDAHPRAGLRSVCTSAIECVQQRGIRAVEPYQRPRERTVER